MLLSGNWYILFDGALCDNIKFPILDSFKEFVSLYKDEILLATKLNGPLLVKYEADVYAALLSKLSGEEWEHLMFIECDADLQYLKAHLRKNLLVKGADGVQHYFRFYDPFILEAFLPTCDRDQKREFFGPIKKILLNDNGDREFGTEFRRETITLNMNHAPAQQVFATRVTKKMEMFQNNEERSEAETTEAVPKPERKKRVFFLE